MAYGAVAKVAGLMSVVIGLAALCVAALLGFGAVMGVLNMDATPPAGMPGNTWLATAVFAFIAVLMAIASWLSFAAAWRTWRPAADTGEAGSEPEARSRSVVKHRGQSRYRRRT